ncbi:major histocompatibility complex class I-related gene protein-like [Myxocyprinus asiaticus]|uniref:major histocompatibility complex class I-related gene protein-like n=1 Tax=Myxocyprinus asiaticus TaxID=70543 RepID=UPI00222295E0|nr:major histocompatibility complex class I-related gene protein-like [Myxocyprinus asiaticus]
MIKLLIFLCVFSVPTSVLTVSHSLWLLVTYIKGVIPFPEFSATFMLDDVTVGHYNSETMRYIPRENTTNEDEMVQYIMYRMKNDLHPFVVGRSRHDNHTEGPQICQLLTICELWDDDKPGQMISKIAFGGSTTDELSVFDNKFTYQGTKEMTRLYLELYRWRHETINYPGCITTLKNYLKKRATQVNRKVKPRVRLIQKANTHSRGYQVICLATGFYPRHISLTLFRDGQPVLDHEITGGDLLPNGDGTYQMRKSLEISAEEQREKHNYTCSATHLSLDNKLDFDPGEPFQSVIPYVLTVLALVLGFGTGVIIYNCRRRRKASSKREYSAASTSDEHVDSTSSHEAQHESTQIE